MTTELLPMKPPNKPSAPAISPTRAENFPAWFQEVVSQADLAENSQIRGCMVLKPDGYAIWEQIQLQFDPMLKAAGVRNAAFPLFIPLEFFQREAKHAEGFATEVAVVTHRRLEQNDKGILVPAAPLEEPLVVRPTSEMIIGDSMARWIQSHRDLPMKLNQWCSVVRMEMRPRLFLRTTEFWWHEGHSAHASAEEARSHTLEMFELYRKFVEEHLAIPVVSGEKIDSERFAGADHTYTLEAMMQDNKALQAATSHNLGQNFARAMEIKFQNDQGEVQYAHTTSWGLSTRLVGAAIMVHSDDDGLRLPPRIAPTQIVILPVIPKEETRAEVMAYAAKLKERLCALSFHGRPLSVQVDDRDIRGGDKNWQAIKKGIPLRVEVGPKDVAANAVMVSRRDLPTGTKGAFPIDEFVSKVVALLEVQQQSFFDIARARLVENTHKNFSNFDDIRKFFGSQGDEGGGKGFARVKWCGDESVLDVLKPLKLTVRCVPMDQDGVEGKCVFTGKPAKTEIIVAKAY